MKQKNNMILIIDKNNFINNHFGLQYVYLFFTTKLLSKIYFGSTKCAHLFLYFVNVIQFNS